jgi:hypothetical protein
VPPSSSYAFFGSLYIVFLAVYLFLFLDVFAMMASNKQCEQRLGVSIGRDIINPPPPKICVCVCVCVCVWRGGGGGLFTLILFFGMLDAH